MSERKFTRGLGKPGMAAQVRETVSQVVRESTVHNKTQLIEPIDFENYILKNKTVIQNDTHRELLLYPSDDVSQVVLPRRYRTLIPIIPNTSDINDCNLFTKMCIQSYTSNWNLIHYKYHQYSTTFIDLPKLKLEEYSADIYEIDTDIDKITADENETNLKNTRITKQGYLMKGPDINNTDRMFPNIGSKSFKKRYCYLRQEVDGTYILELYKDEKKGDAKVTIVMDFCTEVITNVKKGRFCFELRMTAGHKSYSLAADNEIEYKDWINKLSTVLQQNKLQEEKRSSSLERSNSTTKSTNVQNNTTTSACSSPTSSNSTSLEYGTLKSLEQSMNPQLIKYARETELSIAHARRHSRKKLFHIYYPVAQQIKISTSTESTTQSISIEPYKEQFGQRIFVKCENIQFKLQTPSIDSSNTAQEGSSEQYNQIEPYFTSLCLFDARNNKKLTENFYFDINDEYSRTLLQNISEEDCENLNIIDYKKYIDPQWIRFPSQCILSLTNAHSEIYLVVRIDKILQGNITQTCEPYIKYNSHKSTVKLHKTIKQYCLRTKQYRQPFAWSARPLFKMYSHELDTTSEFPAIYRQEYQRLTDEDMLKILAEYRKSDKLNKLTIIPGTLKITISETLPTVNVLSTNLIPIKPYPIPPENPPTFEICEFNEYLLNNEQDLNPYTTFINNLYVYPLQLLFDTQKMFARARNIVCSIELRATDDLNKAKPIACIYKQYSNNRSIFINKTYCTVLHHNTTPSWYDEIKLQLPINITAQHHLLFTFYHVSCDINKKLSTTSSMSSNSSSSTMSNNCVVENCIGYAWIPLLCKGKLNFDVQCVPVATHLPSGYLSIQPLGLGKGNAGPEITWIDNQRSIFTVNFNLVSSINTIDQHLYNLFIQSERLFIQQQSPVLEDANNDNDQQLNKSSQIISLNETELCKILKALHAIQLRTLIKFLPTILNHLLNILLITSQQSISINNQSNDISLNIIRVLINLIHMLYDAGRSDIVQSYIKYVFIINLTNNSNHIKQQIHFELIKHLPTILHPNNTDFLTINKFMKHSSFFFDIIIKSMAQYLLTTGRIKMHRHERFSKEYIEKIESLLQVLVPYITSKYKEMPNETYELNTSLAVFLKKCLSFMDRGQVFKLINLYIDKFNNIDNNNITSTNTSTSNNYQIKRTLNEYKFKLIQIICSHEHYIILNLPVQLNTRLSPKSATAASTSSDTTNNILNEYYLSNEYCKHHYLVGVLLKEIRTILNDEMNLQIRKLAIVTLRDLLAKHEFDDRYQSKGQLSRIAMLYVPFLNIVFEHLHRIYIDTTTCKTNSNACTNKAATASTSMSYLNKYSSSSTTDTRCTPHHNVRSNRFTLYIDQHSTSTTASPIHHLRDSQYFAAIAGQTLINGNSSMSLDSDVSTMSGGGGGGYGDGTSTISQETTIIRNIANVDDEQHNNNNTDSTDIIPSNNNTELLLNTNKINKHNRSISIITSQTQLHHRNDHLHISEIKDLLICVLFILKYIGDDQLITWWQHASDLDLFNFFILLEKCLYCFKYQGKHQSSTGGLSDLQSMNQQSNVDQNKKLKAHTLPARMNPTTEFNQTLSSTLTTPRGSDGEDNNLIKQENEKKKIYESKLDGNVSTECGLVVLDCIGLYSMNFNKKLLEADGDNILMHKIFDIYLLYLQLESSELLLKNVFASLRAFINVYSIVLFGNNNAMVTQLCGHLCYEILRLCNSRIQLIRQEACAILYLLMRSNFQYMNQNSLTRVHLQVIISVSQIIGNIQLFNDLNNARFQESLSLINSYALSDKAMKGTNFPLEVKDLTKRIRTVLMATLQMREHHYDPEMLVDLQHSLANSYASTPELRRTWLETMTKNHLHDGNYSEAAMCQLHIAALMAEYLKLKNLNEWGADNFNKISSNIDKDERSLKLDDGIQDTVQYNEYLLLEQLEQCVHYVEQSERYELLGDLYRLIIPIYERKHDYNQLAHAYTNLAKNYNKIIDVMKSGKRLLGRFYRVAFYSQNYFEEMDGIEYIYKEPKVTTLSEISERLQNQYSLKYGSNHIKILQNSLPINANDLDLKQYGYIQVTHVVPYFNNVNKTQRQTEFELNHDISCFMYETPFTRDGSRAHGTPEEQWKRRTILTTQYSFPYVKKRISVCERRTEELSPIEVAIDEMTQRVSELEDVVFNEPTDIKKLQLRLQGSVCVQVNAGPLAYASVFLDPTLSNLYPDDKVDELKDIFRDFLKICYTALQINSKLITSDQCEYQEALRANYKKLCIQLSTLFGEALWPHDETGSFKRNSLALFSAISGASYNSSTA